MNERGRSGRGPLFGVLLGVALGSALGCSLRDQDEFVTELAAEACRLQRSCGYALHLPDSDVLLPDDETCEPTVEAFYDSCGERCAYNIRKARRCIRRLEARTCEMDDPEAPPEPPPGDASETDLPLVCDAVFTGCEGPDACMAPQAGLCSVATRSDPAHAAWALGILGLGLWVRRRRAVGVGR